MNHILRRGALEGERFRVIVTTDIGGSDPDDFQSMVHYLLYSDVFDTEGLISSPWGEGRASDIHAVIDEYEKDYPKLRAHSPRYPYPDELRAVTFQGTPDFAPYKGWSQPTEASEHIIRCARKEDERPLYLLMWGLLEDLAQALHDAPDILPRLRVHYIGGPNKKWGPNAYAYIRKNFPDLWMIENNSTYRGWFNGGDMTAPWGNDTFVSTYAADSGALGHYFNTHLGGVIKMGDTPTVAWLLRGNPEDPESESWGGSYAPVKDMPERVYEHPTSADQPTEAFAVAELIFRGPVIEPTGKPVFMLEVLRQQFEGFYLGGGEYRVRFVPKETGDFHYITRSTIPEMDGLTGVIRAVAEIPATRENLRGNLTHWWSDRLETDLSEGPHRGAKTVSRWRRDFLEDFAARLARCK
ncbi:MAG: DUF1593 domain-containing protein [Clostridia bacterium]|nr:DUF1593 domain-containing protein [Clostridia bacterium]